LASPEKKVRVQIDLAPQSFDRLKRLKEITEASSYTDVLKDALSLYEFVIETDQTGAKLKIVDEVGRESDLKIFA
jgi:hypothetical protein